ncbi:unnamed protein product, partial [marine sediment metagenome]
MSWPERYNPDEVSALQHAFNIKLDRGEPAFWSEYQNEPMDESSEGGTELTADDILAKISGSERGEVPVTCSLLTMFVDIQQRVLYWIVVAWENDFSGYVIDYGTEPEQKVPYFTMSEITRTLARAAPGAGLEGSIRAGLERLSKRTVGREWRQEGGGKMEIDLCLVDANWSTSTDLVYQFSRQTEYRGVIMPSHGRYVGASSKAFLEYAKKKGDRVGLNWRIAAPGSKRAIRYALYDSNWWKSFVHARLATALGDPGCMSLFGRQKRKNHHQLLADHLTSEYRILTEGRGRTVDEWKQYAVHRDNHWLDGVVGCAVGASIRGATR